MWTKDKLRMLVIVTSCGWLAACGGGGGNGGSGNSPEPATQQGVFRDSPVAGLQYVTATGEGVTDAEGRFTYKEGETVRFFLGGIEVGSAAGKAVITPLDLVAGAADETHPRVVNILRFLQTLDDDANPENGIVISATLRDLAGTLSLEFDRTTEAFESDGSVLAAINSLTAATAAGARDLVPTATALAHFRGTLDGIGGGTPGPGDEGGREVSEEEFFAFFGSHVGVWRLRLESSLEFTMALSGSSVTTQSDSDMRLVYAVSGSGDSVKVDSCGLEGAVSPDEDFDWYGDEDDDALLGCTSSGIRFFIVDENTYRQVYFCDDREYARATGSRVSTSPVFDGGSLILGSDQFSDISTSDGVCGALMTLDSTVSVTPALPNFADQHQQFWRAQIVAPYTGGQRVKLEFQFSGVPSTGTFSVVDSILTNDAGAKVADVVVSSPVFGGSVDVPGLQRGISGTVTVGTVSTYVVNGSFNLTTSTGDKLVGDFALDL